MADVCLRSGVGVPRSRADDLPETVKAKERWNLAWCRSLIETVDAAELGDGDPVTNPPDEEGQCTISCYPRLRGVVGELDCGHKLSDQVDVEIVSVSGHGAKSELCDHLVDVFVDP